MEERPGHAKAGPQLRRRVGTKSFYTSTSGTSVVKRDTAQSPAALRLPHFLLPSLQPPEEACDIEFKSVDNNTWTLLPEEPDMKLGSH